MAMQLIDTGRSPVRPLELRAAEPSPASAAPPAAAAAAGGGGRRRRAARGLVRATVIGSYGAEHHDCRGAKTAGAWLAAGAAARRRRLRRRRRPLRAAAEEKAGEGQPPQDGAPAHEDFLRFVQGTGSPAHTVAQAKERLLLAGFQELRYGKPWEMEPGGCYFTTSEGTSICAFAVGKELGELDTGVLIAAAHTDSPCLKLRPCSKLPEKAGTIQIGVDTYGGGLWHTWFDRPLGMAGKLVLAREAGGNGEGGRRIEERLVHLPEPVCVIPNLAIHLQTAEERKAFSFNNENQLKPVLCSPPGGEDPQVERHHQNLLATVAKAADVEVKDIVDLDLCLMDATPACMMGDFVSSPRIDNVLSTWAAVEALAAYVEGGQHLASGEIAVAASFDHEEVGSTSATGADSAILERWLEQALQALGGPLKGRRWDDVAPRSFLLSCDCAHGLHPNYADKHQAEHQPILGKGIVIKTNSNQRYATTPVLAQMVRELGKQSEVPIQEFVVRNDCPCGSTIGPLLSAQLGLRTVDIGAPQWAMHSCRETAHAADVAALRDLCRGFFEKMRGIDSRTHRL